MSRAASPEDRESSEGARVPVDERSKLAWRDLVLLAPLLAAIAFVARFASPMPITDEWLFLRADMELEGADAGAREGLAEAPAVFPAKLSEHWIIVPGLVYRAIAERAHYDMRAFVGITVALLALQAFLFRRRLIPSTWWALPVVLLLFSPSHYIDFMLGWQYTFALAVAFPLVGLFVLDRTPVAGSVLRPSAGVAACLACCAAGMLSSAPGFFGFPCAMLLVALKPCAIRRKLVWIGVIALVGAVLYLMLMKGASRSFSPDLRLPFEFLTALGAPFFGTPHALAEFDVDALSIAGFLVCACTIAVSLRAAQIGKLDHVALPLAISALGILSLASSTIARAWLGNWHLHLALPAVCGAYAAGWRLWRIDRTKHSAVPFFTLLGLFVLGLVGWWNGIARFGPTLRAHYASIATFARNWLDHPDLPVPYPGTIHLTPELILFLSANEHALFDDEPPPASLRPLPDGSRVFVGKEEAALPLTLSNIGRARMMTVSVPANANARGVVARIGSTTLVLRRIRARHDSIPCCFGDDTPCFAALILCAPLADGPKVVELSIFD